MELASPLPPRVCRSNARLGLIVTALIVLIAGYGAVKTRSFQWFMLRASLRSHFPYVQWISTGELAEWIQDRQRKPPILLDVRTEKEWKVSHVPSARRVDPKISPEMALPNVPKGTEVVTYCAVGYRSGELATRLRVAGFKNVQNLEGGIFAWANEHRPLVHDGKAVTRVHPHDEFWARLLAKDVRAPYN